MVTQVCLTVMLLAAAGAASAKSDLPHPHLPIQLRTEHFRLETDISREFLQHMAPFCEAAHKEISSLPGFQAKDEQHKIKGIWVFFSRDQDSFTAYTKSIGSFAIPSRASGRAYIRCVPTSLYETRRRTLHELCHVYLSAAGLSAAHSDRTSHALEQCMCDVVSWHHWDGKNLMICHAVNAPAFQIRAVAARSRRSPDGANISVSDPFEGVQRTGGDLYCLAHFFLTDRIGSAYFERYAGYRKAGVQPSTSASRAAGNDKAVLDAAFSGHVEQLRALAGDVLRQPVDEIPYDRFGDDLRLQRERLRTWRDWPSIDSDARTKAVDSASPAKKGPEPAT